MNNEDFETYSKKLSILLKEKNKEVLAKKEAEEKQKAEEQLEVKASEVTEEPEDTVIETAVEEAQQEDEGIPNSTTAEDETLIDKYKKAFQLDQFDIVK
jgi:hypothetical protein